MISRWRRAYDAGRCAALDADWSDGVPRNPYGWRRPRLWVAWECGYEQGLWVRANLDFLRPPWGQNDDDSQT